MDFFESQERAKRNTSRLVAMFVVALLATMASVHVLLTVMFAKGNFADVRMLGISLGYPDPDARLNSYRSARASLDEFVSWYD